jgi:hypothetical protein
MKGVFSGALCLIMALFLFQGAAGAVTKDVSKSPEAAKGAVSGSAVAQPAPASLVGKVLEIIDAPPYTYLRLKTASGETWAAVNKASVKKGSEVTIVDPIAMDGFESKMLKRKFDHIVFGTLAGTAPMNSSGSAGVQGAAPAISPEKIGELHSNVSKTTADVGKIKVKKAEGANGKTVEEIYAGKASLKDSTVKVRGKVVKYNPSIMGKNWIHVRDGSGSAEKRDNDIAVTTQSSAAVGDTVTVAGTLRVDKDFGSGYRYAVIIEDATVSK